MKTATKERKRGSQGAQKHENFLFFVVGCRKVNQNEFSLVFFRELFRKNIKLPEELFVSPNLLIFRLSSLITLITDTAK